MTQHRLHRIVDAKQLVATLNYGLRLQIPSPYLSQRVQGSRPIYLKLDLGKEPKDIDLEQIKYNKTHSSIVHGIRLRICQHLVVIAAAPVLLVVEVVTAQQRAQVDAVYVVLCL